MNNVITTKAVYRAGLEVVERSSHSLPVSYAPSGMDATVAYGLVDFKFQNTTRWPIKIVVWVDDNTVTVQILGTK